jgi:hypothetical protein
MRRRNDDIFRHCENSCFNFLYYHDATEISDAQPSDEITDVIADAALPLPSLCRSCTAQVLSRLRTYRAEAIGVGLVRRIAAKNSTTF